MSLRTVSSRKKSSGRRIRNETVETVISCSFETLPDVNGVPHTLIVKLLIQSQRHQEYSLSLRISRTTKIRVVYTPDDLVYLYRIEWKSSRVRYSLKVCELTVVSQLLQLVLHFNIMHII